MVAKVRRDKFDSSIENMCEFYFDFQIHQNPFASSAYTLRSPRLCVDLKSGFETSKTHPQIKHLNVLKQSKIRIGIVERPKQRTAAVKFDAHAGGQAFFTVLAEQGFVAGA